MQIAATANYDLLRRTGEANLQNALAHWEEIVKLNGEANGNFEYVEFIKKQKLYMSLMNDYVIIKAMLTKLAYIPDAEDIKYLRSKGYVLKSVAGDYSESLIALGRKAENIISKIKMKENELQSYVDKQGKTENSFEAAVAGVSAGLGFEVRDDITLARFNEYKRIIKAKVKKKAYGRN